MRYVLDTNAVSALMKGDAAFVDRLRRSSKEEIVVPQPVFAEIAYGLQRLPSSRRKDLLRKQFELVRRELARCLWTDEVSDEFGATKAALERRGNRLDDFDTAIAAHALALGAVLVTANLGHLTRVPGLAVEDWTRRQ